MGCMPCPIPFPTTSSRASALCSSMPMPYMPWGGWTMRAFPSLPYLLISTFLPARLPAACCCCTHLFPHGWVAFFKFTWEGVLWNISKHAIVVPSHPWLPHHYSFFLLYTGDRWVYFCFSVIHSQCFAVPIPLLLRDDRDGEPMLPTRHFNMTFKVLSSEKAQKAKICLMYAYFLFLYQKSVTSPFTTYLEDTDFGHLSPIISSLHPYQFFLHTHT